MREDDRDYGCGERGDEWMGRCVSGIRIRMWVGDVLKDECLSFVY